MRACAVPEQVSRLVMDSSEGVSNQEFVRMHTLIYKLCTIPQVAALPARRAAAALPMADALRCEHVCPWGRCVGVHAHAYVRSATSLCWLLCDSAPCTRTRARHIHTHTAGIRNTLHQPAHAA